MMLAKIMDYTRAADERVIKLFEENEHVPAKAITLFSHVLNAQHIWASRVLGVASLYAVWQDHLPQAFSSIARDNLERFNYILKNIDLNAEITYSTSRGDIFTQLVEDILFHAFNHSTYHRAQIATLFKAEGVNPSVTDYIMLKRDKQL